MDPAVRQILYFKLALNAIYSNTVTLEVLGIAFLPKRNFFLIATLGFWKSL
jgi:hypothetical protein